MSKMKLIGERIREARKEAGLTQVELAAKLGISQPYLSTIETGERRVFEHSVKLLRQIAKATGVKLTSLIQ